MASPQPRPEWSRWTDRIVRWMEASPSAPPLTSMIAALQEVGADLVKPRDPGSRTDPIHSLLVDLPTKEAAASWWDVCLARAVDLYGTDAGRLAALSAARSVYVREVQETAPTRHIAQLAARLYLTQTAPEGVTVEPEPLDEGEPPGLDWSGWKWGGATSLAVLRAWLNEQGSRLMGQEPLDFPSTLSFDRPPLMISGLWWSILFEFQACFQSASLADVLRLRAARAVYETSLRESLRRDGVEDRWGAASDAIVEWQELGRKVPPGPATLLSAVRAYAESLLVAHGAQVRVQVLLQRTQVDPSVRALLFDLLEQDLEPLLGRVQDLVALLAGKGRRPQEDVPEDPFVEEHAPDPFVPAEVPALPAVSPSRAVLSAKDLDF